MSEPVRLFDKAGEELTVYDVAFAQRLLEGGDYTDQPPVLVVESVGDEMSADGQPAVDPAKVATRKK